MFWESVSYTGILARTDDKTNAAHYQKILEENLHSSAQKLCMGRSWTFQHVDPKYKVKSTSQWLQPKKVQVLERPSQSLDLNIIEIRWGDLKRAVQVHTKIYRNCRDVAKKNGHLYHVNGV